MVDFANLYDKVQNIKKVPELGKPLYTIPVKIQIILCILILAISYIIAFIIYFKSKKSEKSEKQDLLEMSILTPLVITFIIGIIFNIPALNLFSQTSDRDFIITSNNRILSDVANFLPADVTIDKFKSDVEKLKNFCQNYYSTSDDTFCKPYPTIGIDDTINKVMNRMYNTDNGKSTADIDNAIKFIKNN